MLDQEKDTSVKYMTPQNLVPVPRSTQRPLFEIHTVVKSEEPISKRESELEVMYTLVIENEFFASTCVNSYSQRTSYVILCNSSISVKHSS